MPPAPKPDPHEEENAIGSSVRQSRRPARTTTTKDGKVRGKRGPSRTSCAECRRLKLKCDGKIPCNQCVRRGYMALCPDGTQQTGQGHRLFWNTTSELRVKLSEMAERIATLEDALHASTPDHPLLRENLLQIKKSHIEARIGNGQPKAGTSNGVMDNGVEHAQRQGLAGDQIQQGSSLDGRGSSSTGSPAPGSATEEGTVVEAFGSLSISTSGGSKYFGHNANSWWLLHNEEAGQDGLGPEAPPAPGEIGVCELPAEIVALTGTFPLSLVVPPHVPTVRSADQRLQMLYRYLPTADEATHLSENAYRFAFFMFCPIPHEQYEAHVHGPIYDPGRFEPLASDSPPRAHKLAILFMILAVGSLVSPQLPHRSAQADRYHQLARATLFGSRVVDEPTIEAIQALHLMSIYMSLHDSAASNTSNIRWTLAGIMMKMSQTMGLHSDPERFGISTEEIKRRRLLFAELYVYDIGQALIFSRPPAIGPSNFDVKPHVSPTYNVENNFHAWKFKFSVEILSVAHQQAYGAAPPSYATVVELTKVIEAYPTWNPPELTGAVTRAHPQFTDWMMQRHFSRVTKEEVLLYLHRPFFAKATAESMTDPLKSPYGASVIAAYRSAYTIVGLVKNLYEQVAHPINRVWFLFANVFGAAVVLGALVIRCPQLEWAHVALAQLDVACELFSQVMQGFGAQRVFEKMISTQHKAHASMQKLAAESMGARLTSPSTHFVEDEDDLLSKLGGKTRTIVPAGSASSPSSNRSTPPRHDPVAPLPLRAGTSANDYHPAVINYLQQLPLTVVGGVDLSAIPQQTQHQHHPSAHHHQQHAPQHSQQHPQQQYVQTHVHQSSHSPISQQSSQASWTTPTTPQQSQASVDPQQQQQVLWADAYNPYQLTTARQGYSYEGYQPHGGEWNALVSQLYSSAGPT